MEIHKAAKLALKFCIDIYEYNVDEKGLFHCVTPDCSLSYKHASLSDSKNTTDHITAVLFRLVRNWHKEAAGYWEMD
jgi:hypothetical protein